jgi:hypothetical protein
MHVGTLRKEEGPREGGAEREKSHGTKRGFRKVSITLAGFTGENRHKEGRGRQDRSLGNFADPRGQTGAALGFQMGGFDRLKIIMY